MSLALSYIRQDQADIRVHVDGVRYGDGNSWVTLAGGKVTAPGAKTRPGGMGREVEVGGPATRSNAVVTTQMSDVIHGQHATLQNKVGRATATVSLKFLNMSGKTRSGPVEAVTGVLLGAELPDMNGEATGAVGMYTLTIGLNEQAA